MKTILQQCENIFEARFMLEQMLNYAISKAAEAEQKATKVRVRERFHVRSDEAALAVFRSSRRV